jgi:hypothetical protein
MRGLFATLACLLLVRAAAATSVIPSDEDFVRSLDGRWHFKLEQKGDEPEHGSIGGGPRPIVLPAHPEPFQGLDYKEDSSWKRLDVPGNWEIAGFSAATYNQPDNAIGLYRLEFDVPAGWEGRIVKVNFDGVQNGAEVYLNGAPVDVDEPSEGRANFHQGGHTAFQADLTPRVKFGRKNLLAVRVYKNTKEVDLDTGDFFFLGGIHRPVTLFSVPTAHLDDLSVRTKLLDGGKAELRVRLAVTSAGGVKASMRLEGQVVVAQDVGADGRVELVQTLDHPGLWSAEHPNLYRLDVDLTDASGRSIERVTRRIGVREVSIKDGVLRINDVPVKFTGMCRHEVYPTLGTAINEDVWRKDITLMKWANVNAIRTSHYPYGARFYDLCDELGMYVMDEVSAGWCDPADRALWPAFAQHARETVRRDKNHPCVVVWAVGNENREGHGNRIAAAAIRALDDTRPRLVSWRRADQYGVELDDLHYTAPAAIARLIADPRRRKYPITFLENPNDWEVRNGADYGCLDLWAHVIDRTWRQVWKDDHVPGSFLWEWQDRAVADRYPRKLYDEFPRSGVNLVKVKGQCDGFRNPRASLYQVKMAYAPVDVDLRPVVGEASVTIHATNRFSFTDLAELKSTWHLMAGEAELRSDAARVALPPRTSGDLTIGLPADALARADSLRLDFARADGTDIVTYLLRLKPEPDTTPGIDTASLAGVNFPRLNLTPVTYGRNRLGWRRATRHPVKLVNISTRRAGGPRTPVSDDAALCATPLADVSEMDADLVEGDRVDRTVGHIHADFAGGRFAYRLDWSKPNGQDGAPTDIQEFGWIFTMPGANDRFSWHHRAHWSWYPSTHIGRPAGTATPDSANVDISRLSRPDAFDFNSTKYDCDWATLTDASGRGLAVTFAPGARHHCRGGINADGTNQLVVNRACAPPRDISSNVVPDLYFTLAEGATDSASFCVGRIRR